MNKDTLKNSSNFKDAPTSGHYLVYKREKVEFDKYSSIDEFLLTLGDAEILEVHLFNHEKEYRAIASESAVYKNRQFVDHLAVFPNEEDTVYSETCFLENGGKLTVLNHIGYGKDDDGNENGMIFVDDYRLMITEG